VEALVLREAGGIQVGGVPLILVIEVSRVEMGDRAPALYGLHILHGALKCDILRSQASILVLDGVFTFLLWLARSCLLLPFINLSLLLPTQIH
jgi:hypothetical protein